MPSRAPVARLRGRRLQERNRRFLSLNPLCVHCKSVGRVKRSEEVDHIIPLVHGGSDDESNLQALCKSCHDVKSVTERGHRVKPRQMKGMDWIQ